MPIIIHFWMVTTLQLEYISASLHAASDNKPIPRFDLGVPTLNLAISKRFWADNCLILSCHVSPGNDLTWIIAITLHIECLNKRWKRSIIVYTYYNNVTNNNCDNKKDEITYATTTYAFLGYSLNNLARSNLKFKYNCFII